MRRPNWQQTELSVGEVSARSGVAVSALRFYERQGLITSTRTSGNQRRYRRDALRRVALIQIAQQVGIPLATLRGQLETLPQDRAPSRQDWERLTADWRVELDQRIRRLEQLRGRFTDCVGCGCLSIDRCMLANRNDQLGGENRAASAPRRRMTPAPNVHAVLTSGLLLRPEGAWLPALIRVSVGSPPIASLTRGPHETPGGGRGTGEQCARGDSQLARCRVFA